jgi:integrase/recombinase XerD
MGFFLLYLLKTYSFTQNLLKIMTRPTAVLKDNYVKKTGFKTIYLRLFIDNKYVKQNLGIEVRPEDWDNEKGLIIKGEMKKENNLLINEAIGRASDILLRYKVQKIAITPDLFIKEFENPTITTEFTKFMEKTLTARTELKKNTLKNHKSILKKLRGFKETIMMSELNEAFMVNFQRYLKKNENHPNTIHSVFKVLKTYVNFARKEGLIKKSPFETFRFKKVRTYPVFLSETELNSLVELYRGESLTRHLQNTLRWFLFSCSTGIRISDLRSIAFENIRNNSLIFKPLKTKHVCGTRVDIPLTKFANELIKDDNAPKHLGLVFQCTAEQVMNRQLKEILKLTDITNNVTFHSGRHTFATMFLRKTKSSSGILMLQRLLGHAKLESTMVYMHVLNDDINDAMAYMEL